MRRRSGREERGDTPLLRSGAAAAFAGAAMKRYPTFKVRETLVRQQASKSRQTEITITEN